MIKIVIYIINERVGDAVSLTFLILAHILMD